MDLIKVAKVENLALSPTGYPQPSSSTGPPLPALPGCLHITPHHLIFGFDESPTDHAYLSPSSLNAKELWLPIPLIQSCTLHPPNHAAQSPLVIRTRSFAVYSIFFRDHVKASLVYESVKAVVNACTTLPSLYAFGPQETSSFNGWNVYSPEKEFDRMGAISSRKEKEARSNAWRWTDVNASYDFCSTYPAKLAVPNKISDVTLKYGKGYRSKQRVPALVYLHWANLSSITRSSQPMVGLKNARSIQDEKLIEAIFSSHTQHTSAAGQQQVYGAKATNLIIDARPTTNAVANSVKGAGTENMEHYKNCKKAYLGIDNIHVMRDSLRNVTDALVTAESSGQPPDRHALKRSGWLRHLTAILEGAVLIAKNVHIANSHVLVHCSDGWDRTAQLSSLAQLCLDPWYRTIEGFAVLIEKDWLSFGHKFNHRAGHLVPDRTNLVLVAGDQSAQATFLANVQNRLAFSSAAFKETCPVFQQFLDCVFQIMRQYPKRFEFDERLLLRLQYELYACRFGSFLYDSEEARQLGLPKASEATESVWSLFLASDETKKQWLNAEYDTALDDPSSRESDADMGVLLPNPQTVVFWHTLFGRAEDDMTLDEVETPPEMIVDVESAHQDPVIPTIDSSGLVERVGSVPTPQQRWQEEHSGSASPIERSQSPASSSQPADRIQSAVTNLWKFGGSSWKSLKQGLQEFQAPPTASDDLVKFESPAEPVLKDQKGDLAQLSLYPRREEQILRSREVSTASSIHFPPRPKVKPTNDPLGAS